jgi:hypothetical protein
MFISRILRTMRPGVVVISPDDLGPSCTLPGPRLACLSALGICLLSGCYYPRQAAFEESVYRQIHINMPVATAQDNLRKLRLTCQRQGPTVDCTRSVDGLLMSCVQRVALTPSDPQALLTNIEVRKIACFGGFG